MTARIYSPLQVSAWTVETPVLLRPMVAWKKEKQLKLTITRATPVFTDPLYIELEQPPLSNLEIYKRYFGFVINHNQGNNG